MAGCAVSGLSASESVTPLRVASGESALTNADELFDALPAAVYVCDCDGLIVRYNRRAAELWGRAPKVGDPLDRFCGSHRLFQLDGLPLPHSACQMADVLRSGVPVRDQAVIIGRPDGSRVVVQINIETLRDHTGAVVGAVNSFHDITERESGNAALRASRADLDDFFENAVVPMHWVSADGIILRANQAELDLLGYQRQEYIGQHIAEFHEDSATIQDILARLSRGEKLHKYPARLRAKSGEIRHVIIGSNVQFREGQFVHTRCITLDVTSEHHSETVLRESYQAAAHLSAIVETSEDAILSMGLDAVVTSWNKGAESLFGYSAQEMIGRSIATVIPPERQDEEPKILERIRHGGRIESYETVRMRKDGSLVHVSLSVSPLKDAAGENSRRIEDCARRHGSAPSHRGAAARQYAAAHRDS